MEQEMVRIDVRPPTLIIESIVKAVSWLSEHWNVTLNSALGMILEASIQYRKQPVYSATADWQVPIPVMINSCSFLRLEELNQLDETEVSGKAAGEIITWFLHKRSLELNYCLDATTFAVLYEAIKKI